MSTPLIKRFVLLSFKQQSKNYSKLFVLFFISLGL